MSGDPDWTSGEVARAITRLSQALEKFEDSVDTAFSNMDQKYVRKDVFDAFVEQIRGQQFATRSWAQQILGPVVPGVLGAFLMWLATSGVLHR